MSIGAHRPQQSTRVLPLHMTEGSTLTMFTPRTLQPCPVTAGLPVKDPKACDYSAQDRLVRTQTVPSPLSGYNSRNRSPTWANTIDRLEQREFPHVHERKTPHINDIPQCWLSSASVAQARIPIFLIHRMPILSRAKKSMMSDNRVIGLHGLQSPSCAMHDSTNLNAQLQNAI